MGDTKISIKIKNLSNGILANAVVSVNLPTLGYLNIKNFTIWKSPNFNNLLNAYINITPPSVLKMGRYHAHVFFENPESWKLIVEQIYKAYLVEEAKSQEVNIDDIPDF